MMERIASSRPGSCVAVNGSGGCLAAAAAAAAADALDFLLVRAEAVALLMFEAKLGTFMFVSSN